MPLSMAQPPAQGLECCRGGLAERLCRQQANAKYNPVRTLLEAAPTRGVSRNDFLGSLLHGMIEVDVHAPGSSKYDVVRFCRMEAH